MSTRKGATTRARPQKHQNRTPFKNDLHDKSVKVKLINSIQISGVCNRCKDILEWKIKYKKYKPLTAPSKCVKCDQKNVKHAYHVMCSDCSKSLKVCAKCCKKEELIEVENKNKSSEDAELQAILKTLPERKRRTLIRYIEKQQSALKSDKNEENASNPDDIKLTEKIEKLKLSAKNKDQSSLGMSSDSELDFSESDESEN